jgi:hypothetical protein
VDPSRGVKARVEARLALAQGATHDITDVVMYNNIRSAITPTSRQHRTLSPGAERWIPLTAAQAK